MRWNTAPAFICLNRNCYLWNIKHIWVFISLAIYFISFHSVSLSLTRTHTHTLHFMSIIYFIFVMCSKFNSLLQHFNLMIKNSFDFFSLTNTKKKQQQHAMDRKQIQMVHQTGWYIRWTFDRKMTSTSFSM